MQACAKQMLRVYWVSTSDHAACIDLLHIRLAAEKTACEDLSRRQGTFFCYQHMCVKSGDREYHIWALHICICIQDPAWHSATAFVTPERACPLSRCCLAEDMIVNKL